MTVRWFSSENKKGTASFYNTNIVLSTVASIPFGYAYRVQVGMTNDKRVVIKPLDEEKVQNGGLDKYTIFQISLNKTYSRICSVDLMRKISNLLGIELSDRPIKFDTKWDDTENVLIIQTNN